MSNERQINYVNNLQNRAQNLYYVDDASELNNINLKENDKIYAINDNKLFQMEVADQEEELSGNIVSFNGRNNTKVKELTVDIEPVQDLHGYDNPWPAGGTKQMIPDGKNTENGYVEGQILKSDGAFTANAYAYICEYFPVVGGEQYTYSSNVQINTPAVCWYDSNKQYISGVAASSELPKVITAPANAAYARCTQYIETYLYKTQVEKGTTATTPILPYSNICPISGWTGAKVAHISDSEKQPYFSGLLNGTYGFVDLGTLSWHKDTSGVSPLFWADVSLMGKYNPSSISSKYNHLGSVGWDSFRNSTSDKISAVSAASNYPYVMVKDSAYTDADTFKAAMSGVYLIYKFNTPTTPTITQAQYNALLQSFNLGGWLVPISWQSEAGAVYGGTLDVTNGVLTVDRAMVDLGTRGFVFNPSVNRAYVTIADVRQKASWNTHIGLCSCYSEGNISNNSGDAVGFGFYNTTLYIRDPRFTSDITTAQIQSLLSGQTLVYELATTIEITLTPTEVTTLLGTNNIWADTGNINIKIAEKGITAFELEPYI